MLEGITAAQIYLWSNVKSEIRHELNLEDWPQPMWTQILADLIFKLVDDQSSTRARPRHIPTLSNCTHTLNRIIDWGEWILRQEYTYYNTRTSFNQSSNMESELALHLRASRFQECSDSTYGWAIILQKRNRQQYRVVCGRSTLGQCCFSSRISRPLSS